MTVVAPGSAEEVRQLLPQILHLPGPCYLRIGGFGEPDYPAAEAAVLGRARLLQGGEDLAVLSTGSMAGVVAQALVRLAAEGCRPIAYQVHTVKPLDTAVLERLARAVRAIVVVEEHVPGGGLAAAVSAWEAAQQEDAPRVVRVGPLDRLALGNLSLAELRRRMAYDADAVAAACWRALGNRCVPAACTVA